MPAQPRKLSEIMKEMSETLLRNPSGVPSSEAAHVALFFANVAWNESIGLDYAREGYRNVWIEIWTHAIGGLSENDFILAAKIDTLPIALKLK